MTSNVDDTILSSLNELTKNGFRKWIASIKRKLAMNTKASEETTKTVVKSHPDLVPRNIGK
jgi:glycerol-3-phosphate responsive antiterminator